MLRNYPKINNYQIYLIDFQLFMNDAIVYLPRNKTKLDFILYPIN